MAGTAETLTNLLSEMATLMASGQTIGAITPQRVQSAIDDFIQTMATRTPGIVVTDPEYGAVGDGVTDDSAAITAAIAAAVSAGAGGVFFPSGRTYLLTEAITSGVSLFSDTGVAVLKWKTDLGSGVAGLTLTGATNAVLGRPDVENLFFQGPGSGSLGNSPCAMDGLQIGQGSVSDIQPVLRNVNGQGWHSGVVINTNTGHIHFDQCEFTANYYGCYIKLGNGDLAFKDCSFGANYFAGIGGSAAGGMLGGSCYIYNTELGFQPYGIYQEAGSSGGANFMQDAMLIAARFESIGNGAIVSKATLSGESPFFSAEIHRPGFSWNPSFQVSGAPSYAIDVPYLGGVYIRQGDDPFTPGSSGTPAIIHCQDGGAGARIIYDNPNTSPPTAAELIVSDGAPDNTVYATRVKAAVPTIVQVNVASGQTTGSTTVNLGNYAASSWGLQPIASPVINNPGSLWWISLGLAGNSLTVTANLASPAPASGAEFYIRLIDPPV